MKLTFSSSIVCLRLKAYDSSPFLAPMRSFWASSSALKTSLVVGDGDLVLLSGGLVGGGNVQDSVSINIEGNFDLWDSTWCWWDSGELELSKQVVVLGHGTLSFVDLDQDSWLVVGVGGEGLSGLGWDGGVSLDESSHDTSGSLNTERKWGNVEKEKILDSLRFVSGEDGGLNSSSIGNSLVWVDRLVEFLSGEEVRKKFLDLWDTSGSSDENDVVDLKIRFVKWFEIIVKTTKKLTTHGKRNTGTDEERPRWQAGDITYLTLVHLGVTEGLLDWVHGGSEEISAELLETSTSDVGVEIDSLEERVDLNRSLG
ncbi:hypothetical protein GCK72_012057 [Caenorhabditis remanei]|uniref:Uncharacterized protein n=1 Tax=Caenorhabditis remanei TaxID=31234 RepID=A0A6A5GJW1_CAERE|nr:hypothetical protein GCK72_012057 [Caenorhabditis remanei]KAF1755607.1 hypothetical protein GCK72_012057 [Caenorhabditis remanei]